MQKVQKKRFKKSQKQQSSITGTSVKRVEHAGDPGLIPRTS